MAFIAKVDYFGLEGTALDCTASNDGKSASVAEAKGNDGSIVAHEVYGEQLSPSCDYQLVAAWTSADDALALGTVKATDGASVCLGEITINTSAGAAPTISASGEQVEQGATADCTYKLPGFTLPKTHHAQILFDCATVGGNGCHLTAANYTMTCSISKATVEGVCVTHDVTEGKIEAALTIVQTGTAVPTLTAGEGWTITAPLAGSNPDADYPTFSATLTKYLAK